MNKFRKLLTFFLFSISLVGVNGMIKKSKSESNIPSNKIDNLTIDELKTLVRMTEFNNTYFLTKTPEKKTQKNKIPKCSKFREQKNPSENIQKVSSMSRHPEFGTPREKGTNRFNFCKWLKSCFCCGCEK